MDRVSPVTVSRAVCARRVGTDVTRRLAAAPFAAAPFRFSEQLQVRTADPRPRGAPRAPGLPGSARHRRGWQRGSMILKYTIQLCTSIYQDGAAVTRELNRTLGVHPAVDMFMYIRYLCAYCIYISACIVCWRGRSRLMHESSKAATRYAPRHLTTPWRSLQRRARAASRTTSQPLRVTCGQGRESPRAPRRSAP